MIGRVHQQTGMTLIELMTALAIGSILILGAVRVLVESRGAFRAAESLSRLHENARFVIDAIEPDVRMAGFWGLTARASSIDGRADPSAPALAAPSVGNDCGTDWTIRLDAAVEATNNGYRWTCMPYGGRAREGADTLAIRRVASDPIAAPERGTWYVRSSRYREGLLFLGPSMPPALSGEASQTHRLLVRGYYVSPTSSLSTADNPVPSLRAKTLQGGASGPRIVDEEVLPGIEDLQIELGIDTDPPGAPGSGSVNRYVNPGDPLLHDASASPAGGAKIRAVRLWLLLRAEQPEGGYLDTTAYTYADRYLPPRGDGYRRMLVARTIHLRNAADP